MRPPYEIIFPLVLLAGCGGGPERVSEPPVVVAACELTVIVWSEQLQSAVPAVGTVTGEVGFKASFDTSNKAAEGQTLTGLEPGRYVVSLHHRVLTKARTKRVDGEEAVYLEPGERRSVTVVAVDREGDIGSAPASASTLPASAARQVVTR